MRLATRSKTLLRLAVMGAVVAVAVTGCSTSDSLAEQYGNGTTKNYISGDGAVTEIKPADRSKSIEFSTTTSTGTKISRNEFQGKVVVLNFWYAACPPCRVEAPALETLSKKYQSKGVQFIGVNVRDETDTATAFERNFHITYPTIIDATNATVQLALAGSRGPNATPTTIVLDQKGRVAARVLGEVNESVLDTLVSDTVAGK